MIPAAGAFWWLIKNPRIVVIGATVATVAFLYVQLQWQKDSVQRLLNENSSLRVSIAIVEQDVATQKEISKIASGRISEQESASKTLQSQLEDIANTPESENGEIAPVLKKVLENRQ